MDPSRISIRSAPPAQPVYIEAGGETAFAIYHPAGTDERTDLAIVFCPPFGWEDLCSFRSRRTWAELLAAEGRPALRLDLPSTGDSGGSPRDVLRLEAWTDSVSAAADWLRAHTGCTRVAAIGIGLGGMLVVDAVARGAAIDDLVLWATPARGRSVIRELRAFARLNAVDVDPVDDLVGDERPSEELLREGALEVGGFLLSAETLNSLGGLDLTSGPLPQRAGRRVLMIERDGIPVDARLRDHFAGQGLEPDVVPGAGYAGMMAHPQETVSPQAEIAAVSEWLGEVDHTPGTAGRIGPEQIRTSLGLAIGGEEIRETPVVIEQPFGNAYGILAEPTGEPAPLCVVLLNAGALRRIGPGRLWVDLSRQWAARGVPTLRVDLEAIGDSGGSGDPYPTHDLYSPKFVAQVVATLDHLQALGKPDRFVLAGLCSGAYWSFQAALDDPRVVSTFLINPRALFWDSQLEGTRSIRLVAKMLRASNLKRIIRGEIPLRAAGSVLRSAMRAIISHRSAARTELSRRRDLEGALDRLRDSGRLVSLVFGENEPLHEEFESTGLMDRLGRWPNLTLELIPGRDHTLRPIVSQDRIARILGRELDRVIALRGERDDRA